MNDYIQLDAGQVFVWGYGILGKGPIVEHSAQPTEIPHSLFGRNEFNPHTKVVSIHSGLSQFAAISDTGDLYMWGRNRYGSLGLGHLKDQFFPIKVEIKLSSVISSQQKLARHLQHIRNIGLHPRLSENSQYWS